MKMVITLNNQNYDVALDSPLDISIPICFEEEQLSAFGAPPAQKQAYASGDFLGDVSKGGSCNCETYTITPHCNGTHTESIGHISSNDITIHDTLQDIFIPACVISVTPEKQDNDLIITKENLEQVLSTVPEHFTKALVIRTLPNTDNKITRYYGDDMPPYFTANSMQYIHDKNVQHLLVDMPSVDRLDDGGKLLNHRIFWNVAEDQTNIHDVSNKTITELIYVPNTIADGSYVLNLQVAAFKSDAAPSRPVLFEVKEQ